MKRSRILDSATKNAIILITFIVFCSVLIFQTMPVRAKAHINVILRLDRDEATVLDSIRMEVKISGIKNLDDRPEILGLDDFDINIGATSSRVEIVNNKMSSGIDYTYTLQPKKAGDFRIGPARVIIDGRTFESNILNLTISEPTRSSGTSRGVLFLQASLSSGEIYVDEQTVYKLKLYRQVNLSDLSLRLPETENLIFKQLGKPVEYQEIYNKQKYQVLEVRYALIPSQEGTIGIRPARMTMIVHEGQRRSPFSLFDDPFFSSMRGEQKTVASEPLELNVFPLPEQDRPADFSGLVGTFDMDSRLEPREIRPGESATLTVIMHGRGNVNLIPDLKIPELEGIKTYSDEPVLEEGMDSKGLKGSKTMKFALVPETEGRYRIPQMSVSFFDTEKRQYRTIQSKALLLSVLPGAKDSPQTQQAPEKEPPDGSIKKKEVTDLGRDILPFHGSLRDLSKGGIRPSGLFFWIVLLFPLFVYSITLAIMKSNKRSVNNLAATKAKRAAKILLQQTCGTAITSKSIILAFQDYLNNRFGLEMGSITSEEATKILLRNKLTPETAKEIGDFLLGLEDKVYTGKGDDPCEVQQEVRNLIKRLEREIR